MTNPVIFPAYAGIGSRETPADVLGFLTEVGTELALQGWTMRSGRAEGADETFERATPVAQREIFLPSKSFGWKSGLRGGEVLASTLPDYPEACRIAAAHHGLSKVQDRWAKIEHLMARNVFQVLGRDLKTPSVFVVCWAPKSRFQGERLIDAGGGTGQAVRVASTYNIPVYNVALAPHRERVARTIARMKRQREEAAASDAPASTAKPRP